MDEEGDIADGPNGPVIFHNGRWVPYNGGQKAQSRLTPLTPPRPRDPSPQTPAQAQKDQQDAQNAALTPGNMRFQQTAKLRDDYNQDPAVKAYQASLPVYASALNTPASPAGDLQLIYAFAKLMDPTSAVREGEFATVAGSDTFAGRTVAQLQNQLSRSGTFSPEMRQDLRVQLRERLSQYNRGASQTRERYRQSAEQFGLNPDDVIGPYPGEPFEAIDRAYWKGQGFQIADEVPDAVQAPDAPREVVERASRWEMPPGSYIAGEAPPTLAEGPEIRFSTDTDKQYANALRKAFANGAPTMEQLDAITQQFSQKSISEGGKAYPALPRAEWQRNIDRRRKGGSVNIGVPQSGIEKRTQHQQNMTSFLGSEAGAGLTGVANAGTFGLLDEGVAAIQTLGNDKSYEENLDRANTFKQLVREEHPYWYGGGEIVGGVAQGMGAVQGLKGLGVNVGTRAFSPTAIGVDAALAGAYGAGEDNESRGRGFLTGAAAGAGGGIVGRGALNQAGRMAAPTGGNLRPLYEEGVRPTPGQRFGGAIGVAEEALSSTPILGGLVRSARQGARDQFETGAFNQALRDIGKELPADQPFGTRAHAFAQKAFDKAYGKVRKRMQFVRDAQFDVDLQAILKDADDGALSQEATRQLKRIIASQVDRRAPQGIMSGDAFKDAQSFLGARLRAIRNTVGADQELGDALERLSSAIDSAARRNSPAKVVQALDATDSGYAKLVRIEEAARRLGGEAGRFTPAQFDSAVQRASGGQAARSKAYLRGDALMQDYGTAGRSLMDTLPNSGTADRVMLGQAIGGTGLGALSSVTPIGAATIAGTTLPYGLHKLTGGLMAPRPALDPMRGWFERMAPRGGDILRQLTVQKNMENQRRGQ